MCILQDWVSYSSCMLGLGQCISAKTNYFSMHAMLLYMIVQFIHGHHYFYVLPICISTIVEVFISKTIVEKHQWKCISRFVHSANENSA